MQPTKLYLLLIGCLISIASFSQNKTDLTGNWKVNKVSIPENLKHYKGGDVPRVENMFLQGKFHFNADGTCKFDTPEKEMQFKNTTWTFNEKDKSILIKGEVAGEKGALMKMFVSIKDNKWYFTMDDMPVLLEVQKIIAP
jgi:hypothetical protein